MPEWTFLSNHAQVLLCIAQDPDIRLREIGDQVGITERAVHRIVSELADARYITRERRGRRNRYTVSHDRSLPEPLAHNQRLGTLLELLGSDSGQHRSST
ncbi:MAG TPA: winged helix-turn-helix domain-containing protein [Solirubrobacteraceae bacterium]|jgi:predicted transcriptional regulator|nr:winged helix-turn-helix domain-containing protein [Solirubrobacteraceae bacterium]